MRAAAALLFVVLAVGLAPKTEGWWFIGAITEFVNGVVDAFSKRRRGLQDIVGLPLEDKERACLALGTARPVTTSMVDSLATYVDANKETGSVDDDLLTHEEIAVLIGCLEALDYCNTKAQNSP